MSALYIGQRNPSPVDSFLRWWREWWKAPESELVGLAEEEIARVAKDVGVSTSALRRLVSLGADANDLLQRRMTALDLDKDEVLRRERGTFQDMQRVCAMCESHRLCARHLAADADSPGWKDYCPNASTLTSLSALPWSHAHRQ
jgi:hypothetical protein